MVRTEDTIVAVATPPGRGGVGIIRVSGPWAADVARTVLGRCPPPRQARFAAFRGPDGEVLDEGIALYFPGPRSFTGEDVLELQGHGGPVVLDMVLSATLRAGARMAEPGEFSKRAYLNGKMDLAQAESIADLIEASSDEAARCAVRSLQGEFSGRIQGLDEAILELRMYVESAIDFPEEEVEFLAGGDVLGRIRGLGELLRSITDSARQGRILREGMTLVIAGRPNAGKSSLLNLLVGEETAIVTEVPGTTRDVLRERIHIDGMPLHIIDTAGLRHSADEVEQEGIRRARREMERADRVLAVVDDVCGIGEEEQGLATSLACPVTLVFNKIDCTGRVPGRFDLDGKPALAVSARTGAGIPQLREFLKESMGYEGEGSGHFMARRRHLEALDRASDHVSRAADLTSSGAGELVAEELRLAHTALGEITGETTPDDLLGRIFSSFCIGK